MLLKYMTNFDKVPLLEEIVDRSLVVVTTTRQGVSSGFNTVVHSVVFRVSAARSTYFIKQDRRYDDILLYLKSQYEIFGHEALPDRFSCPCECVWIVA